MEHKARVYLILIILFFSCTSYGQIYDGNGNMAYKLGIEIGKYKYLAADVDVGLSDLISLGFGFNYLLNSKEANANEIIEKIGIEFSSNFHLSQLINSDRFDFLAGLGYRIGGAADVHLIGEFYFNDFIGIYGRVNHFFAYPQTYDFNFFRDTDPTTLRIGLIFKAY